MIPPHPQRLYLSSDCVCDFSTFFTLLIATLDFTASAYCNTCYRHLLHSFILRQSSPVIVELVLRHFTDTTILTDSAALSHRSNSIHFSDPSVTSHHHPDTCHTHPTCVFTSITTPLFVLLVSVQRIAEPLELSHCHRFGHVAVTPIALPSVFGFCCCALH